MRISDWSSRRVLFRSPLANLADEGEGRLIAGMPARARRHRDDPVDTHFGAFPGMAVLDDVLKDETTVRLQFAHQPRIGREGKHDDRHLVTKDELGRASRSERECQYV